MEPTMDEINQVLDSYRGHPLVQRVLFLLNSAAPDQISASPWHSMVVIQRFPNLITPFYRPGISHQQQQQQLQQQQQHHHPAQPHQSGGSNLYHINKVLFASEIEHESFMQRRYNEQQRRMERLEADLAIARNTMNKDQVRIQLWKIAELLLEMGDHSGALKSFIRSRDFCLSSRQVLIMCIGVIRVATWLGNWGLVNQYIAKAEQTLELTKDASKDHAPLSSGTGSAASSGSMNGADSATEETMSPHRIQSVLNLFSALSLLAAKKYKNAAKKFLEINADIIPWWSHYCSSPSNSAAILNTFFDEQNLSLAIQQYYMTNEFWAEQCLLVHPKDIARLAIILSAATFDRKELKSKLLDDTKNFKNFMELIPDYEQFLRNYYNSRYSLALRFLSSIRSLTNLDIFLAPHASSLWDMIRNRSIVNYVSPFSKISLTRMARQFYFNEPVPNGATAASAPSSQQQQHQQGGDDNFDKFEKSFEEEIAKLIAEGAIQCRIDSHNKILIAKNTDQCQQLYSKSFHLGAQVIRESEAQLLRMNLLRNDFAVRTTLPSPSSLSMPSQFQSPFPSSSMMIAAGSMKKSAGGSGGASGPSMTGI